MKHLNIYLTLLASLLLVLEGCHSPEMVEPALEREGITNLKAKFPNDTSDDNLFSSEIDHEKRVITVVFPYNYPKNSDNVLPKDKLKNIRVWAELGNTVRIEDPILYMDLTKENHIVLLRENGERTVYTIISEIRKSREAKIEKFVLPKLGLTGIIRDDNNTIALVTTEPLGRQIAEVTFSHGATLDPDPRNEPVDFDVNPQITVIAQDGVTKKSYKIVKERPSKVSAGFRKGSEKLIWVKKLTDIGYTTPNMACGVAPIDGYVVLNERNNPKAMVLDANSGAVVGSIDISEFAGNLTNFYVTSDNAGHILFCNFAQTGQVFTIWRVDGIKGKPVKYAEYTTSADIGRKISVIGDLDGDALITAPFYGRAGQFVYWTVKDGQLQPGKPKWRQAQGAGNWGNNADVIFTNPSSAESDYLMAFYAAPNANLLNDGKTNAVKAQGPVISTNWIMNAIDYTVFNNVPYALSMSTNSFSWGEDDTLYLFDLSTGQFGQSVIDFGPSGLGILGKYGGKALGVLNANGTGDVALHQSKDGFYMNIYFMFTNGYVGCVRVDCIDM